MSEGRSYDEADRVACHLGRQLEGLPWLRGIAVEGNNQDYAVVVRVASELDLLPNLPDSIDGVPVRMVRRRLARAL
jgi:hypothetical protein